MHIRIWQETLCCIIKNTRLSNYWIILFLLLNESCSKLNNFFKKYKFDWIICISIHYSFYRLFWIKCLLPPENITRKETKPVLFLCLRLPPLNSRVKMKQIFFFFSMLCFIVIFYCVNQKHLTKYTRKYCIVLVLRNQH